MQLLAPGDAKREKFRLSLLRYENEIFSFEIKYLALARVFAN